MKFHLILLALLGASSLFGAETSAFKSKTAQNEAISNAQSDIVDAKQNIEGLQSVVGGLGEANQKLSIRIGDVESALKDDISVQIEQIKKSQAEQSEKLDKLTEAVKALGAAMGAKTKTEKTDKKRDSKQEEKKSSKEQTKSVAKENAPDITKMEPKAVLDLADKAYKDKKYSDAKKAFALLLDKNYKPAYANFMLGEIAYNSKQYADAIPYYRASVNLYDKGNYMPKLLYHTAISCDKIGDTANANKFYAALKQAYPDSAEAKAAPTRN